MKKSTFILLLLFFTSIVSCNTDDNVADENEEQEQEQEQELIYPCDKLYKKSRLFEYETPTAIHEVSYDSNYRINEIFSADYTTITSFQYNIVYEGEAVSKIVFKSMNEYDSTFNTVIEYDDIVINDTSFTLNSSLSDNKIEIFHTDGYVDNTRYYYSINPPMYNEEFYTRNEQNQIVSNTFSNSTYTYSNYVNGEDNDPIGSTILSDLKDIILILKLKYSSSTPLTLTRNSYVKNYTPEFEGNSCIIKNIFEENRYFTFEYITP